MTDITAVMQKLTEHHNFTKAILKPLDPGGTDYAYLDGIRQGLAYAFSLLEAQ